MRLTETLTKFALYNFCKYGYKTEKLKQVKTRKVKYTVVCLLFCL